MSDAPDRSDKQFDPTPRRLEKAREDGNVFRSRELASAGLLAAATAVIGIGAPGALDTLRVMTARLYTGAPSAALTPGSVPGLLADVGRDMLVIVGPLFAALLVVALGTNVLQSGWTFSAKPLRPKGSRISPAEGAKRLFSTKGLFELGKALAKVVIVGPVVYLALKAWLPEILVLHTVPLDVAFRSAGGWTLGLLAQMLLALLLLSGVDYAFGKWKHTQDLKMTHKEVKDEAKESEGDPHLKGKRKQIARERALGPRLDHAVLQADVVVTNPTHYAVALKYDAAEGFAPKVLVKGMRKRALRIKALAAEHGVPTVEDVPLARALHATVDEGAFIDEALYGAVAAVLAEVYRQRDRP
ncbi:EscU/YscU/HrcU family type III secretion system export apparatus switch protein [Rubrivirga marina]|uniref:Flagellar biosynthesis protein FlhB n=1 Tax=Rubrivirga marina TaxID=1196024 RepID=A0A271IWY3_9BACT|nr:EscU/YscU/HrcU family type III secretion system export apparatus switch protein [Rubrivirga marina]PAP75751.1 flagellar biosynthesis protein FlhB [Rubrivirga marina]